MTEARDEWSWIDTGPTFSAPGRRRALVEVPHGVPLPRVGAGYVGTVLIFSVSLGLFATGVLFWFQTVVLGGDAWGWWWMALVVPAAAVALVWGAGTYAEGMERTMSSAAVWRIIVAAIAGALVITGVGGFVRGWYARPLFSWRDGPMDAVGFVLLTFIALIAAIIFAVIGIRTARRARAEVRRIHRLHAEGRRVPGMVLDVPDPQRWPSYADVTIRIDDPANERVVRMRVNTDSAHIPVRSTRVVAFVGGGDDYHVELDPEHPTEFVKDTKPYRRDSADGGSM